MRSKPIILPLAAMCLTAAVGCDRNGKLSLGGPEPTPAPVVMRATPAAATPADWMWKRYVNPLEKKQKGKP